MPKGEPGENQPGESAEKMPELSRADSLSRQINMELYGPDKATLQDSSPERLQELMNLCRAETSLREEEKEKIEKRLSELDRLERSLKGMLTERN